MALDAAVIFEMRTTGDPNNGGGFKAGAAGVDYSQQDSAQKSGSDLAIHASDNTKVQPGAGVSANDVGNLVRISAGTGFTVGWYEITAQDGTYWTLDRACGTISSTGGTYAMGGAVSTFQDAMFEGLTAGNKVYIKSGTYTLTETLFVSKDGTHDAPISLIGYGTTRGDVPDYGDLPLVSDATYGFAFDDFYIWENLRISGNANQYYKADSRWTCINVHFSMGTNAGVDSVSTRSVATFIGCSFTHAKTAGRGVDITSGTRPTFINCIFYDSDVAIYSANTSGTNSLFLQGCLFVNCTQGLDGTYFQASARLIVNNCTFYGAETPSGTALEIEDAGTVIAIITNSIFYGFTTAIVANTGNWVYEDYNTFYNNTADSSGSIQNGGNSISVDPQFTDAGSGDFSVGTDMKAIGISLNGALSTASYIDLGAAQREEPAGGGGGGFGLRQRLSGGMQ